MRWSVSFEGNSYVVNDVHTEKKEAGSFLYTMGCIFFFWNLLFCFAPFQLKTIVPVTRKFRGWLSNEPECPAWTFVGSRDPTAKKAWRVIGGVLVSAGWLGLNWWDSINLALVFAGFSNGQEEFTPQKWRIDTLLGTIWHPFEGAGMQSLTWIQGVLYFHLLFSKVC